MMKIDIMMTKCLILSVKAWQVDQPEGISNFDKFCTISAAIVIGYFYIYLLGIPTKHLVYFLDLTQKQFTAQEPPRRRR
jgi:hypothetical protein